MLFVIYKFNNIFKLVTLFIPEKRELRIIWHSFKFTGKLSLNVFKIHVIII